MRNLNSVGPHRSNNNLEANFVTPVTDTDFGLWREYLHALKSRLVITTLGVNKWGLSEASLAGVQIPYWCSYIPCAPKKCLSVTIDCKLQPGYFLSAMRHDLSMTSSSIMRQRERRSCS